MKKTAVRLCLCLLIVITMQVSACGSGSITVTTKTTSTTSSLTAIMTTSSTTTSTTTATTATTATTVPSTTSATWEQSSVSVTPSTLTSNGGTITVTIPTDETNMTVSPITFAISGPGLSKSSTASQTGVANHTTYVSRGWQTTFNIPANTTTSNQTYIITASSSQVSGTPSGSITVPPTTSATWEQSSVSITPSTLTASGGTITVTIATDETNMTVSPITFAISGPGLSTSSTASQVGLANHTTYVSRGWQTTFNIPANTTTSNQTYTITASSSQVSGTPSGSITTTSTPLDTAKYGFESSDIYWVPQTSGDSQAITGVERSDRTMAKYGDYSLKINVDLIGGDANKSKGETYIDMRYHPPTAIAAPVDFRNMPISVWVYVSKEAVGDPNKPNGIQLFVKDQNWYSEYGTWFNLAGNTDKWVQISFTPSIIAPPNGGYVDSLFDPSKIITVGVKIGAGGGSTTSFKGPIYIDGVNW